MLNAQCHGFHTECLHSCEKMRVYHTRLTPMPQSQLNVNGKWLNVINKFSVQLIWIAKMWTKERPCKSPLFSAKWITEKCLECVSIITEMHRTPHCKRRNQGVSNSINVLLRIRLFFGDWNISVAATYIYLQIIHIKIAQNHSNA